MFQFQSVITENGKTRNYNFATSDNSFTNAAKTVMQNANVRDGASVLIARMAYDTQSRAFAVIEYTFDVVDGKVKNLEWK